MKDYHKILGIDRNATDKEIKKAYRKIAMKHHPDKNPNDELAAEKFRNAAEAYNALINGKNNNTNNPFSDFNQRSYSSFGGGGINFEDIFGSFTNSFTDMYGNTQRGKKYRKPGQNIRIFVEISIKDIINGVTKKIKIKRDKKCQSCSGKGGTTKKCATCSGTGNRIYVTNSPIGDIRHESICNDCSGKGEKILNVCNFCNGKGVNKEEQQVEVEIPSGVNENIEFTMHGYGNESEHGIAGDLFIRIKEKKHSDFIRSGDDIIMDKNISVIDAILGKKTTIKTPNGEFDLNIKPGTQPNDEVYFYNKGIPSMINSNIGNIIVKFIVKIPTNLNLEEKTLLDRLKNSSNFKTN